MDKFTERTYGLAGMFQAAALVQQVARKGEADRFAKSASLNSVLILDAINTLSVYSDKQGIKLGLRQIQIVFGERNSDSLETFQYVAGLSQLAKNLSNKQSRMDEFSPKVASLSAFSGDELVSEMAKIYKNYISDLEPRILVNGEQGFLAKEDVAEQVRAFLLAGIRSAFLWHQKGGSRWEFMFKRGQYVEEASNILRL
jgi:high frequency lysogenization protein